MSNEERPPKRIYLQRHENPNDDFSWTWAENRIKEDDVEYVLASTEPAAEQEARVTEHPPEDCEFCAGEIEADEDIAAGRVERFELMGEALKSFGEQEAGEGEFREHPLTDAQCLEAFHRLCVEPSTTGGEREKTTADGYLDPGHPLRDFEEAVTALDAALRRDSGDVSTQRYWNAKRKVLALLTQPQEQGERIEGWVNMESVDWALRKDPPMTDRYILLFMWRRLGVKDRPATLIIHPDPQEPTTDKEK